MLKLLSVMLSIYSTLWILLYMQKVHLLKLLHKLVVRIGILFALDIKKTVDFLDNFSYPHNFLWNFLEYTTARKFEYDSK